MNPNLYFVLILLAIFGLVGVGLLIKGIRSANDENQSGSKLDNIKKETDIGINFIVGGWFIVCVLLILCMMIRSGKFF